MLQKKKKREEKLQRLLRRLKKNNTLNRLVYENTDPIGSFPAKTYGFLKCTNLLLPAFFLNSDLLSLL